MKLYKTTSAIIISHRGQLYKVEDQSWEEFINDDSLFDKMQQITESFPSISEEAFGHILPPIGDHQELWACGVTYMKSKMGRQEESQSTGGADFYAKVYEADRPEVFFKANPNRIVGHQDTLRIRKDSTWDVPEPELTLVVSTSGKIVGYTIGNDMSSRSIEGENPLYLPQAKTYDRCAAIGPCIYVIDHPIDRNTQIGLQISRNNTLIFEDSITLSQMKRKLEDLVSYVYRECTFPYGCLIMTGTGIVPGSDFTLHSGDEINISIEGIGELKNTIE